MQQYRLVWYVKMIVAATEFCRCDLSHEFKLVWIRATYRSDKMSASSLVAACVRICDKSLRQNLNQPMREHQLVSRHVLWTSLHFLSSKLHCVHRSSVLSQRLVAASVQTRRLVAAMCRSDLWHRVSWPLLLHHRLLEVCFSLEIQQGLWGEALQPRGEWDETWALSLSRLLPHSATAVPLFCVCDD